MNRVVITGFGAVSSIGNSEKDIMFSLKNGKSGITISNEMKEMGIKSHVFGNININKIKENIPFRMLKYMNSATIYAYLSMQQAIISSKLSSKIYRYNPKIGLIIGSGTHPSQCSYSNIQSIKQDKKGNIRMNPHSIITTMPSNLSAVLSTIFNIQGFSYSISSACTTSSHCIGHAFELIRNGQQTVIFSGGAEELSCQLALEFDSMKALSTKYNNNPVIASRPYDKNRDGFVISGGGGVVVLEELQHAINRSAYIYGEIKSYASVSDGFNMLIPSDNGALRCMKNALKNITTSIDYINMHGTSTKIGDKKEGLAVLNLFKNKKKYLLPPLSSSTKSITGHALGASGVHEIIYCLLMIKYNFIAPNINIENIDPDLIELNIATKTINKKINVIMSNNFGFGGSNVVFVISKYNFL
ncbi:3-oxoacyl-[acyl-carrier-protein] synthase 1 [Buchnera aphidicola (Thelaxes suberi)]|uniref:beta-ketoacyl synthase N-terminal-like domain-containing protein n=1 Tax=Buchnera aphidicola TaxID=9 RepID=UPI0034640EBF